MGSWHEHCDPGDEQPINTVRGMISKAYHAQQHFEQSHDVQLAMPEIDYLQVRRDREDGGYVDGPEPLWATEQEKAQLDAGETAEELTARLWMPWDGVSWHDQRFSVIVFDFEEDRR